MQASSVASQIQVDTTSRQPIFENSKSSRGMGNVCLAVTAVAAIALVGLGGYFAVGALLAGKLLAAAFPLAAVALTLVIGYVVSKNMSTSSSSLDLSSRGIDASSQVRKCTKEEAIERIREKQEDVWRRCECTPPQYSRRIQEFLWTDGKHLVHDEEIGRLALERSHGDSQVFRLLGENLRNDREFAKYAIGLNGKNIALTPFEHDTELSQLAETTNQRLEAQIRELDPRRRELLQARAKLIAEVQLLERERIMNDYYSSLIKLCGGCSTVQDCLELKLSDEVQEFESQLKRASEYRGPSLPPHHALADDFQDELWTRRVMRGPTITAEEHQALKRHSDYSVGVPQLQSLILELETIIRELEARKDSLVAKKEENADQGADLKGNVLVEFTRIIGLLNSIEDTGTEVLNRSGGSHSLSGWSYQRERSDIEGLIKVINNKLETFSSSTRGDVETESAFENQKELFERLEALLAQIRENREQDGFNQNEDLRAYEYGRYCRCLIAHIEGSRTKDELEVILTSFSALVDKDQSRWDACIDRLRMKPIVLSPGLQVWKDCREEKRFIEEFEETQSELAALMQGAS